MEDAEAAARANGRKYVMSILQRPEQLEKVAQYRRRVARKKASVDASVKTALQSQLDGVRKGLELLRTAQTEVVELKKGLEGFGDSFKDLPELDAIKEEQRRHSQYVTAMENLKHIFTVPESVKRTKNWIADGKLLYARQSLAELENSRDDLMFELHKQSSGPKSDMVLLNVYFEDVSELSTLMEKQIRLVLARTLNTVRKEPTVIVTALRVIEGEEAADEFAIQRSKQSGFMSPGRPKKWREMALGVLRDAVESRIVGTQTNERENDKMWLVKHLELTLQLVSEDLRVVRTLCVPCFPPSWDIVRAYTNMYQDCIQAHIDDIISRGLIGNEIVNLLEWALNTYPTLGFTGPLLSAARQFELQNLYLSHIDGNLSTWMQRTLGKEQEDWEKGIPPEQDGDEYLSPAPSLIGEMIAQNISVAETVSVDLVNRVQGLCVQKISNYAALYGEAVRGLRARHFADRSHNLLFTQHMIAVINNCVALHNMAAQWRKDERSVSIEMKLRDEAINYLLQEAFTDLKPQFDVIFSQSWLNSDIPVDTIFATFEDYFLDYTHLKPENMQVVLAKAQSKIAKAYIYKIIQGNISFSSYEERKAAVDQITNEIGKIRTLFAGSPPATELELIEPLTEILRSEDREMLALDLHRLVVVCPDITDAQMTSILLTRGDMSRADVREKVQAALSEKTETKETFLRKGMFTLMGKSALNLDWDHYWSTIINS